MIKFLLFCCPKLNIIDENIELLIKTEYRIMKKLVVLGMGVCLVLAFASCKSSESAYKKAYEKAKQQELAEPQVEAPVEVTPVVAAPVTTTKVADTSGVRQEKVTVVSGNEGLKDYSVVAGRFWVKANAEGLKDWLDGQGYHSTIAFNADKAMYRVIVNSFADKAAAAEARDAFKAKYPNRSDFQGAWLLYRVY
jgi:hypothetical protein